MNPEIVKLLPQAVTMALIGGGGLWLLRKLRQPGDRPGARSGAPLKAMGDLLEELRRTSQSMTAGLDRRSAELKVLIAEADLRIEALKGAAEGASSGSTPTGPVLDSEAETTPEMKAVFEAVYRQSDAGRQVTDIARETGLNKTAVSLILNLRGMRQREADGSRRPGAAR